jgi:hypothetical protein
MGHKGVSKRKPPKEKLKPLATANRGSSPVSSLVQSESAPGRSPEKAGVAQFRQGGTNPSSGSKKRLKNR